MCIFTAHLVHSGFLRSEVASGIWVRPPKISPQLCWNIRERSNSIWKTLKGNPVSLFYSQRNWYLHLFWISYLSLPWRTRDFLATSPTLYKVARALSMNWLPSVRRGSNPHLPQDSPGSQDSRLLRRGDLCAVWSGTQELSDQKESSYRELWLEASNNNTQLGHNKHGKPSWNSATELWIRFPPLSFKSQVSLCRLVNKSQGNIFFLEAINYLVDMELQNSINKRCSAWTVDWRCTYFQRKDSQQI